MLELFESSKPPRRQHEPEELLKHVFSPSWTEEPQRRPPVVTIGGAEARIASEGNICVIVAQPGVGKSAVCEALCSTSLNPNCDAFGLRVSLNYERKILYVDSERDIVDHYDSWKRMLRRSGIQSDAEDLLPDGQPFSQSIVDYQLWTALPSSHARTDLLFNLIESDQYALVVVDGFGDFVSDVNDGDEVDAFASGLRSRIIEHRVAVFGTIHANPNDEKARGHLGSELIRRAESVFILKRDEENTAIRELTTDYKHGKVRNAGDLQRSRFQWDPHLEMFSSVSMPTHVGVNVVELDRLHGVAWNVFADHHLSYDEVRQRMEVGLKMTRRQADQDIQKLVKEKIVQRSEITRKYFYVGENT